MASRTNECPHFGCYIVGPHDHRSSSGADPFTRMTNRALEAEAECVALLTALRDCVEALNSLALWHAERCSESCKVGPRADAALDKANALLGER